MNTLKISALALLFGSATGMSQTYTPDLPAVIDTDIKVQRLYVPQGFDSNDNTEVVVSGYLPSLCYQAPRASFVREGNTFTVKVTASLLTKSLLCAQVIVPFHLSVSLGVLPAGSYEIRSANGQQREGLVVTQSLVPEVDQHIYAQVHYIESSPDNNHVVIHAYSPSYCLEYDRTDFIMNQDKTVLAILPIMKRNSDHCPMKMTPFKIELDLTAEQARDNLLLHVRSMEGRSANAIFHFDPNNQ